MMKGQKGITLVALVITIIVMLILVGVSITVAMQSGLFDKARQGVEKTDNAVKEEQGLADGTVTVQRNNAGNIENVTVSIDNVVNGSY